MLHHDHEIIRFPQLLSCIELILKEIQTCIVEHMILERVLPNRDVQSFLHLFTDLPQRQSLTTKSFHSFTTISMSTTFFLIIHHQDFPFILFLLLWWCFRFHGAHFSNGSREKLETVGVCRVSSECRRSVGVDRRSD